MLNFKFLFAVLWQKKLAVVLTFGGLLTAAAAFIGSMPSRYVAESLVAMDSRPLRSPFSAVSAQELAGAAARVDPSVLAGEVNLLSSRQVLDGAIALTGLGKDPEFASADSLTARALRTIISLLRSFGIEWFAGTTERPEMSREEVTKTVAKALTVEIPKGSAQIRISFSSIDPAKAARVANAIVATYLQEQAAAKQTAAAYTTAELRLRLDEFRQQLIAGQAAVQAFRDENHLLKTGGVSPLVQQLNEIVVAEQKSRLDAEDATARLELFRAIGPRAAEAAALASGTNQEMLSRLATQENEIRVRLARETSTLGPFHPTVLETRTQLRQIGDAIASIHALMFTTLSNGAIALTARHARLAATLLSVKEELARENALEAQLDRLTSDVRVKQAAYEEFLTGYNRTLLLQRGAVPDMRVLYPAETPGTSASSKLPLLFVSIPIAALFAAAIVLMLHQMTRAHRQTAHEFEGWSGVPIIGICPAFDGLARQKNPVSYLDDDPLSEYAEAIRAVRNALDFDRRSAVSVAITSASIGEGKSTLAVSLATAWAAAGVRTLLIDCDMRRPALPALLPSAMSAGLTDFLVSSNADEKLIQSNKKLGFDFMAAGPQASEASYRFTRTTLRRLIDRFSPQYDRIILDLPPVLAVSDSAVGAAASDVVLFVTHWGYTRPDDARSALEVLRKLGVTDVRAVLCRVDRRRYARLDSVSHYASYGKASPYESQPEAQ